MTRLDLFDYELPEELIAVTPAEQRDESRLLCLDRETGQRTHRRFSDITDMLGADDVLILNDARVLPVRIWARRSTGGRVEVLLVRREQNSSEAVAGGDLRWVAMLRAGGTLREGEILHQEHTGIELHLMEKRSGGYWVVELAGNETVLEDVLEKGEMPLPPYIRRARRQRGMDELKPELDRERYQTVFARRPGAVAAPTAGLHFTRPLLERIEAQGVSVHTLSLLVGPGTFRPVRTDQIEEHSLDAEFYYLPEETARAVKRALEQGRRVVATGTTCCRVLEYVVRQREWEEHTGWTDLFIYPPFEFRVVGALITNFHLPRSTLLMLVSAFAGRENVLAAYGEAVEEGYRFYSYGDATFLY
jgi:S-adenosylmethionine:tRNA ribosyltransferase-isomerase